MKKSRLLTLALAFAGALTLLAAAIAAPILFRPFYYVQIAPLQLCAETGLTESEIRQAYDEMLDYCLGGKTFSTGVLRWSESGKSHFTDVRSLFLLDLWVLAGAVATLFFLLLWSRLSRRKAARLLGRGPAFWAGSGLGGAFILVGGLAALDFDRAFVIFHALFFPGKDNWLFDETEDQIISILPDTYFRNCALLILGVLILGCIALIFIDLFLGRKARKRPKKDNL